jgi:hypothetical protein
VTRAGHAVLQGYAVLAPGEAVTATDPNGTITRVLITDSTAGTGQSIAPESSSATITRLVPGHSYIATITATAVGAARPSLTTVAFSVAPPPSVLHFTVTPANGATASTDAQVTVEFDHDIPQNYQDPVAAHIAVIASWDPGDVPWRWTSPRELTFRPPTGWHHGDKAAVVVDLAGIQAGPGLWAVDSSRDQFTVS